MPHHALDLFRTTARQAAGLVTTLSGRAYRTAAPLVRRTVPGRRGPVADEPVADEPVADGPVADGPVDEQVGAPLAEPAASAPSPAAVARVAHRRPVATPTAAPARTPSPDAVPGGKLPPRR